MVSTRYAPLIFPVAALAAMLFANPCEAQVPENRLLIASQMEFGNNLGYYLDFENAQQGTAPCKLNTLKLILGVADGTRWQFTATDPNWRPGTTYNAIATITPTGAKLILNGDVAGTSSGGYKLAKQPIVFNHVPSWAHAPTAYTVNLKRIMIETKANSQIRQIRLNLDANKLPEGLRVFAPDATVTRPWQAFSKGTIVINVTFTIDHAASLKKISPLIDKFGQNIYANWPGKIKSTAQLIASQAYENHELARMPLVPHRDKFGGTTNLGWHMKPTGYFTTVEHDGRWWLITPLGNPCYYVGVCSAPQLRFDSTAVNGRQWLFQDLPSRTGKYAPAWSGPPSGNIGSFYNFNMANMIRKYGAKWQQSASMQAETRLKHWGFCGAGKWSSEVPGLPWFPVLGYSGVPVLVRHPDVWNPSVRTALIASLKSQITPLLHNPYVVGWSIGNEFDEIVTTTEITQVLAKPAGTPERSALISWALHSIYHGDAQEMANAWGAPQGSTQIPANPIPPAADVERMRQYAASYYYRFLYTTVKNIDPNHLYFGFWLAVGWWQNPSDWSLIAPWCDVIGYDFYNRHFADNQFNQLIKKTHKPILCGEYSFPPIWANRGFGAYPTNAKNTADAGRLYTRYVHEACDNPYSVGDLWFEYRDEPLTGRDSVIGSELIYGEHYAFGVVDVTDRPKWALVKRMRAANGSTARWHSQARKATGGR